MALKHTKMVGQLERAVQLFNKKQTKNTTENKSSPVLFSPVRKPLELDEFHKFPSMQKLIVGGRRHFHLALIILLIFTEINML